MNISCFRGGALLTAIFPDPRGLQIHVTDNWFRQTKPYFIVISNQIFSLLIFKISPVSSHDFRENIPLIHKGTYPLGVVSGECQWGFKLTLSPLAVNFEDR